MGIIAYVKKPKAVFDQTTTNGHVCFVYSDAVERMTVLADYFKQGIAKSELCVFVTYSTQEDAIKDFQAVNFDATKAVAQGFLRIFEMEETYLPQGQFVKDFMLTNVQNFMNNAKENGFSGLRTAGEMSWINDHPEAFQDAVKYEEEVNALNQPEPCFVGLCLYPAQSTLTRVLEEVLHTHPTLIHQGQAMPNPVYQPA